MELTDMHKLFLKMWGKQEDEVGYVYCFETGRPMYAADFRLNPCCYDHILEQGKFPEYRFLPENIVIVHPDIHATRHQDITKTPKIEAYREKMLSLHYENKLKKEEL